MEEAGASTGTCNSYVSSSKKLYSTADRKHFLQVAFFFSFIKVYFDFYLTDACIYQLAPNLAKEVGAEHDLP